MLGEPEENKRGAKAGRLGPVGDFRRDSETSKRTNQKVERNAKRATRTGLKSIAAPQDFHQGTYDASSVHQCTAFRYIDRYAEAADDANVPRSRLVGEHLARDSLARHSSPQYASSDARAESGHQVLRLDRGDAGLLDRCHGAVDLHWAYHFR